uniref:Uncharacterized protein n=1 Tax=Romanomermis culicivorax TaxID=13658 RepID=A0A915HJE0_ROMCU
MTKVEPGRKCAGVVPNRFLPPKMQLNSPTPEEKVKSEMPILRNLSRLVFLKSVWACANENFKSHHEKLLSRKINGCANEHAPKNNDNENKFFQVLDERNGEKY